MKKSELKELIKEEIKKVLNEGSPMDALGSAYGAFQTPKPRDTYSINIEYIVDRNWFSSPSEVLQTNLYGMKSDKVINSYTIKNQSIEGKNYVANIHVISLVDKPTLKKYLDNNSVRSETYIIK